MKKMVKVMAIIAVLVMAVCCFAGCSSNKSILKKIEKAGELTVLTEPGFAPFEYIDANGEIAGVDVEIAKKVAAELGVEANIMAMDFDGIIAAVQAGKGDIGAAGITATEERAKMVSFSTNYVDTGIYIIVPEGSEVVTSPDSLSEAGVVTAVQLGTTSDLFVSDICAEEPSRHKTVADAVVALQAGKVQAVVADELPAKDAVANNPGLVILETPLTVEQYAIAVAKENTELLEVVNKVVEEMVASGEMEELIAKHMELAAAVG